MSRITHEQARLLLREDMSSLGVYTLRTYIKQQERDSELSELYKELATLYRDRFDYADSASEIQRFWGKIKELENDSRENV